MEIMFPNAAIRNLIREDKVHQIYSQMQVGQAKFGMQTMNQALLSLYERGMVSLNEAGERSPNPDEFRQMVSSAGVSGRGRTMQSQVR